MSKNKKGKNPAKPTSQKDDFDSALEEALEANKAERAKLDAAEINKANFSSKAIYKFSNFVKEVHASLLLPMLINGNILPIYQNIQLKELMKNSGPLMGDREVTYILTHLFASDIATTPKLTEIIKFMHEDLRITNILDLQLGGFFLSHLAAQYNNLDLAKYLESKGKLDIATKDNQGRLPIQYTLVKNYDPQNPLKSLTETGDFLLNKWLEGKPEGKWNKELIGLDFFHYNTKALQKIQQKHKVLQEDFSPEFADFLKTYISGNEQKVLSADLKKLAANPNSHKLGPNLVFVIEVLNTFQPELCVSFIDSCRKSKSFEFSILYSLMSDAITHQEKTLEEKYFQMINKHFGDDKKQLVISYAKEILRLESQASEYNVDSGVFYRKVMDLALKLSELALFDQDIEKISGFFSTENMIENAFWKIFYLSELIGSGEYLKKFKVLLERSENKDFAPLVDIYLLKLESGANIDDATESGKLGELLVALKTKKGVELKELIINHKFQGNLGKCSDLWESMKLELAIRNLVKNKFVKEADELLSSYENLETNLCAKALLVKALNCDKNGVVGLIQKFEPKLQCELNIEILGEKKGEKQQTTENAALWNTAKAVAFMYTDNKEALTEDFKEELLMSFNGLSKNSGKFFKSFGLKVKLYWSNYFSQTEGAKSAKRGLDTKNAVFIDDPNELAKEIKLQEQELITELILYDCDSEVLALGHSQNLFD